MLKEALAKVGILPEDTEFEIALSKLIDHYCNSGGSNQRAGKILFARAKQLSEGGQDQRVSTDHIFSAPLRQPVEDARGQGSTADKGHRDHASPSSFNRAQEANPRLLSNSGLSTPAPVREPKPQRAAIDFGAASVAIKTKLAQSVLDRAKTSDGRAWGDVGAHELDGMSRDGALAKALKDHLGMLSNEQRFKKIRDLVNPETFEAIRSQAHGA